MRIGNHEIKRRVWIGLIFALTATGVWWGWTISRKPAAVVPARAQEPFVQLVGVGVLRERAEYFDPTPLFFPTEWNFSTRKDSIRRQPGDAFGRIEANLVFESIKGYSAEVTAAPKSLSEVVGLGDEAPFDGMGRIDVVRPPLEGRSAVLEIRNFGSGNILLKQVLNDISFSHPIFQPLEFLVAVSSAGLVGEPALISEIGGKDVDPWREEAEATLRIYLAKTFRLGERLSPGRYRVLVGP